MRRLQLVEQETGDTEAHIPGGVKVAFASTDRKHVDAHFGSAPYMMIYEISATDWRFIEAIAFDDVNDQGGKHSDENQDRIEQKISALKGCAILFVLAIGGGPAARVVNNRIYPIKVQGPESFPTVISRVQTMLQGTPPPWLRKLVGQKPDANAFSGVDFEEED